MDIMPKNINDSWNDFIENESNIEILKEVRKNIGNNFYPRKKEVLRFLKTDLNNCKCVLMGMDPYRQDCVINNKIYPIATGRSFEVRNLKSWEESTNKSLTNILKHIYKMYNTDKKNKEIAIKKVREDIKNNTFNILPPDELFNNLEKQGVIFLNSALTLKPNESGSHIGYWNEYMDLVITYIDEYNTNIKWLLLGKDAKNRVLPLIDEKKAIITNHPVYNSFVYQESFEKIKQINWKGI